MMRLLPIGMILCSAGAFAAGPDYAREERPVADTIDDAKGLLYGGFSDWNGSNFLFKPRSYYFNRDRDTRDSKAWALGGSLGYQSDWWNNRLRIASTLYTSQKLYGPDDNGGTLLLEPGQDGFTVLGEAFLELKLSDGINARAGRTALILPYINQQDNRMVPNTFMAYGVYGNIMEPLAFATAHITKMKRRDSDDFIDMSKAAGFGDTDEPVTLMAMRYGFTNNINLGFLNLYSWEYMNVFYAEGNASWQLDELALGISTQFTDQQSIGDEIGGDFNTNVYGAKLSTTYKGATLSMAFSRTNDDGRIRSPYGSYPGYLSLMVKDFNRAGEDAWLLGMAYDFSNIGWQGVSAFMNYAEGRTGNAELPNQSELDITVDIRSINPKLEGLWLRLRHARIEQDGAFGNDLQDWRVLLNYTIPLL